MFDVTFLIPDYGEEDFGDYTPPCPDDVITDAERERLYEELFQQIDAGAFDPDREILI